MKKCFVLILASLFSFLTNAQDTTSHPKYALSFGIAQNFTLSKFELDIAVKRIYEESQLRLFVSPRISIRDDEDDYVDSVKLTKIELNSFGLGVGADYLWKILQKDDFQMYSGPGITVSYSYGKENLTNVETIDVSTMAERISRSYRIGLRGSLGAEWFVSSKIGIHSEYLFTLYYSTSKNDIKETLNKVTVARIYKTKLITLNSSVLFGISIYF